MSLQAGVDHDRLMEAVSSVDDPEYEGVSIVDLGIFESIEVNGTDVTVELIPTFSGCPALDAIRDDVAAAVRAVPSVGEVEVAFVLSPVWSPARITEEGRAKLAREFTVEVELSGRTASCPRCGSATTEVSAFGPTRCRSISRCDGCAEVIEVMR